VRALGGATGIDRALKGLTFLASATDRGRPGDGDSHSIAFTHNVTTRAVTFASEAHNLSSRDGSGLTDVYQRVMTRRYGARVHGRRVQRLAMDTRLVSAARDGCAGSAASHSPGSNVDGTVVAFVTTAGDLAGRSTRGIAQVVKAHVAGRRPRLRLASRSSGGGRATAQAVRRR
jgi:hypothetical protein